MATSWHLSPVMAIGRVRSSGRNRMKGKAEQRRLPASRSCWLPPVWKYATNVPPAELCSHREERRAGSAQPIETAGNDCLAHLAIAISRRWCVGPRDGARGIGDLRIRHSRYVLAIHDHAGVAGGADRSVGLYVSVIR